MTEAERISLLEDLLAESNERLAVLEQWAESLSDFFDAVAGRTDPEVCP